MMSTLPSGSSYIEIPLHDYVELKNLAENGSKQDALRNLNALLFEKDQDLLRYKEKYEQCEKVLKRTQLQLDSLLKKQCQPTSYDPFSPNVLQSVDEQQRSSACGQIIALRASDGTGSAAPALPPAGNQNVKASPSLTARGWRPTATEDGSRSSHLGVSAVVDSSMTGSAGQFDEVDSFRPTSSVSGGENRQYASVPCRGSGSGSDGGVYNSVFSTSSLVSCGLLTQPTVSTMVLKNLVKENLRMKKILEDLKSKDCNIAKLIDSMDAEHVILKLRQDLQAQQKRIDELTRAGDSCKSLGSPEDNVKQGLLLKIEALESKIEKQARALDVKHRVITSLNAELVKNSGQASSTTEDRDVIHNGGSKVGETTDIEKLQKDIQRMAMEHQEEKLLLTQQLSFFRDDFEAERQEKRQMCDSYESRVAELTGQVANLMTKLHNITQPASGSARATKTGAAGAVGIKSAFGGGYQGAASQSVTGPPTSFGPPPSFGSLRTAMSPMYSFSSAATLGRASSLYNCPQCSDSFTTEASFKHHIDKCFKSNG